MIELCFYFKGALDNNIMQSRERMIFKGLETAAMLEGGSGIMNITVLRDINLGVEQLPLFLHQLLDV